ncbi:hypothetical protein ES332_D01G217700v1 [Gossypium tomentosum]|uniref:Uncharacterized protein n=1 Tax=Gossypium tomentosum TaxID=34277 RepID=A0A5D2MCB0_GOSTO|nr:hypothetical protein ES332_D01G217700v1 [Gossypium tomentosum]
MFHLKLQRKVERHLHFSPFSAVSNPRLRPFNFDSPRGEEGFISAPTKVQRTESGRGVWRRSVHARESREVLLLRRWEPNVARVSVSIRLGVGPL